MRITWLSDVQAPYREPLFCAVAMRTPFHVHFVLDEEPERHFRYRPHPGYRSEVLPSIRLPLPGPLARRLDSYQAVLHPGATRRLLDSSDVLVIPTWAEISSAWAMVRARRRGVPYVLYSESTLTSRRYRRGPVSWLRRRLFLRAGAVVVPGPAAREAALANGVEPDRIVDSVNSIDLDAFAGRTRGLREPGTGPGPEAHRFAVVGQLIARKNVDGLLRAFARLDGRPTLDVAGDGVELPRLRALAAELGVAERVRFLGFLAEPQVLELLAVAQTLALPSTEEVYGMTALEARVAGLQVVVSDRAGVAANLAGTPGAWIVDPGDDALTAGLAAARRAWAGWTEEMPDDAASPERTADDLVRAARIARGSAGAPADDVVGDPHA